jgi:hypothetical protein
MVAQNKYFLLLYFVDDVLCRWTSTTTISLGVKKKYQQVNSTLSAVLGGNC